VSALPLVKTMMTAKPGSDAGEIAVM
jgi:hypothetical protein